MKHFHITTRSSSSSTLLDIRVYITWPTVNGCSNRQTMENDCVPTRCPVLSPLIHSICQFTRRHWSSSGASSSSSNDDRRPTTNFAHPRLGPAPAAISNWTSLRREPSSSHPPAMVLTSASDCNEDALLDSTFASRYLQSSLPKFKMPEASIPKEAAYRVISDELMLDGNPRLNLASFVTTWMEDECNKIIMDSINKNFVDMDEYPITTEIQNRCVNMIARLFHAPLDGGDEQQAIGCATVGSSEAIMLAGLAFKRKWQNKRKAEGKPFDKPNIVTGANVQVCWEKFARYFEVELKEVKLREGYYVMDPVKAVDMVDENTICVCAILGSTYNGEFEDVKTLNRLLEEKNSRTGWNTPIHVDAASGGFVAPFIYPELEWDFKLSLVRSINVSGHKYGLVYAGVGWAIWKSQADLPEDLIFHINYLGSDQPTFTLNFSKGSSQIIAQYYQFLRLGFHGYKQIIANCAQNAKTLTECLQKTGQFNILSKPVGVPVVAFSLNKNSNYGYDEYVISDHLRRFGWIVPAYTMAPDAQHVSLLRVVVREEFSKTLCDRLVRDILFVLQDLDHLHHPQLPVPGKTLPETAPAEAELEMEAVHDRGDVVVDDSAAPSMTDAFKHFAPARVALRLLRSKASDKTKAVC